MPYRELLEELKANADEKYREFHGRLLKNDGIRLLGVRVPVMRKIAKSWLSRVDELITFPDEYYEVTFVKLTAVSCLKWEEFIVYIDRCVPLIDNWATCDCFVPKCITKYREEFLPYIEKYSAVDKEFYQRFALVSLLHYYVDEPYLGLIFKLVTEANRSRYYVHMAAAWLIAEVLVKFYGRGVEFLRYGALDAKTHNKAIQKACESYRLSNDRKTYLKRLKR